MKDVKKCTGVRYCKNGPSYSTLALQRFVLLSILSGFLVVLTGCGALMTPKADPSRAKDVSNVLVLHTVHQVSQQAFRPMTPDPAIIEALQEHYNVYLDDPSSNRYAVTFVSGGSAFGRTKQQQQVLNDIMKKAKEQCQRIDGIVIAYAYEGSMASISLMHMEGEDQLHAVFWANEQAGMSQGGGDYYDAARSEFVASLADAPGAPGVQSLLSECSN